MTGSGRCRIALAPSPALATAILAAHGVASGCVLLVLSGWAGAILGVLVLALGVASARDRALLATPGSPRAIELADADRLTLESADGRRTDCAVGPGRWVTRWCVALPVQAPRRRTLLVTAGMAGEEPFRLLRLWARWGRTPAVAAEQPPP